jgi:ribonuclease R
VRRAYQLVEELMLLANELVAQWLSKRRCPAIYRVHDRPDAQKLERLAEVAERLGAAVDLEEMQSPLGVARFLRDIQEHPRKQVLEMMLLRSLKQAVYDIVNIGHFGLASEAYLHFTSPIRRYPDVEVHRAVKQLLRGKKPDQSPGAIELLRAHATQASTRERAAMEVEREVVDLHRTLLMRDRVGDIIEGTVTAITGGGLYVTLDQPFVDVLVRYDVLGPDQYQTSDDELEVVGLRSGDRIALGDRVVVQIEEAAVLRRSVYARRIPPERVVAASASRRGRRDAGRPPRKGRVQKQPEKPARAAPRKQRSRPVKRRR